MMIPGKATLLNTGGYGSELQEQMPGVRPAVIEHAVHIPDMEQPEAFNRQLK